jgi:glycosyltransferase involved in cell wall biosynthesis
VELIDSESHALDQVGFGGVAGPLAARYTKHFGYIQDARTLRLLFSADDVFALPSRPKAFGRTVIEAFACGTPVVVFAGTVPNDIITAYTGRQLPAFNTEGFAGAMLSVATASADYSGPCRKPAVEHCAYDVIARQYTDLYEEVLAGRSL